MVYYGGFMNRYYQLIIVSSILFIAALTASSAKAQDKNGPMQENLSGSETGTDTHNLGSWLASIYREYISPVDGSRCPSIPSCSTYSLQAFKKHGFFLGWVMTVDRLIHEGKEETDVSPIVYSNGKWKILDPLENNDFWWYRETEKTHNE